jgi:L-alanine-DL-glutamate epimerase-like enolase superfamily enzyme
MHVGLERFQQNAGSDRIVQYAGVRDEGGVCGFGGPLYPEQAQALGRLAERVSELLKGRDPEDRSVSFAWMWNELYPDKPLNLFEQGIDPLTNENHWDTRRDKRHTPTGNVVTALSAVDNALWDVRGKLAGKPVYELLGGTRKVLPAYISTHPGDDVSGAVGKARELYDEGNHIQKWFFQWGPVDGEEGFTKCRALAEGIRAELGSDATLMFDFATGQKNRSAWDVEFAVRVARMLEPLEPLWLEEPFHPEEIDSYRRLKGETSLTLAAGEHTYSRWNIKPFLDEGLIGFVQSDPEWCGGVSESLEVAKLVSQYEGVVFVPHGHQALAASHVVASHSQELCPMVEHGRAWLPGTQRAQTRILTVEAGTLVVPPEPGLGPDIDFERFSRL